MSRLRIVTFNIAHGRGLRPMQGLQSKRSMQAHLRRIAALLVKLDADVVALQEIDQDSSWAGNFDHLEYLREHTGYAHALHGVTTRRAGVFKLCYGNAFLSRHELEEGEAVTFGVRTVGEKGFLFAEITVGGKRVPLINLHLHYRSRAARLEQVGQVFRYLAQRHNARSPYWNVPPIVCGDFNTSGKASDATAGLLAELEYFGTYAMHPASGRTFPSPLPTRALDFVLVPMELHVTRCEVVRSWLSDHRPVVAEIELGGPRPKVSA
jgi:endonuclease/exonuclease/phosphatase family metal-dependent hydrolase